MLLQINKITSRTFIIYLSGCLAGFFVPAICFPGGAQAQEFSQTSLRETGIWNGIYIRGKISDKIGYYGEHHLRFRNSADNIKSFVGRTRQFYNRAGVQVTFNKYFEVVVGPTLVLNYTPDRDNPNLEKMVLEPRIWHQWLLMMPQMGRVKLYHQFRFEHRWKRDNAIGSDFDYTDRFRYKLFAYIPLNKKNIEPKTLFFSPSAEIFMHSGKSIVRHPFEDFRTYNGLGYVYNPNVTFFAGHMWTLGQNPSGFEYSTSHIIRLNVFIGLDFRKTENKLPPINLGY